ncbi:hypothetical protein, conserved, partial [Eimeria tenella]
PAAAAAAAGPAAAAAAAAGEEDLEELEILPKERKQKFKHFINQFDLIVCDANGNRVAVGGHCVSVRGSEGARVLRVCDEGEGLYKVFYVKLQKQGLLPFTSCRLDIFLFEKPILSSPLKPLIANLEEVQQMYKAAAAATKIGASINLFEKCLREGLHDKAARILEAVQNTFTSQETRREVEEGLARIKLGEALGEGLAAQLQQEAEEEQQLQQQQQQQQQQLP